MKLLRHFNQSFPYENHCGCYKKLTSRLQPAGFFLMGEWCIVCIPPTSYNWGDGVFKIMNNGGGFHYQNCRGEGGGIIHSKLILVPQMILNKTFSF